MKEMRERTVVRVKGARIPKRLGPYFQEYDFKTLNLERDANIIMQRTLEFGTIQEIQWLFRVYGKARVKQFVRELGERGLSRRGFNYWKLLLGVRTWRKSPFPVLREQLWTHS